MSLMQKLYLLVPLAPLAGAILAGLFGRVIGRTWAHRVTIIGVALALAASVGIFQDVRAGHIFDGPIYVWACSGGLQFELGFLIDNLTVLMMLVVTFISLMVHIYSIGYMADDRGYQRFFSYISLFTFSMLVLVMSNNFLQLFFGWEAVGLVSYLLIGFWFTRPTATAASLKAFLVNRVGDIGLLLGIGLIAASVGTLNYTQVFTRLPELTGLIVAATDWPLPTAICIALFVGAMGKSAQIPLHVWLPDSMEGPTPISALIHAATMVTAGIFMVARMAPIFELSETARSFVLFVGATTALFMGILGITQNDIKRVIAYSTISQLGYMTVALGVSAYSVAIFHLMTHAFFKALLFLCAGSVIISMHHEQDMRNMGGLWRHIKLTWITFLIGAMALVGVPFTSGFYSKESIIEAVKLSGQPGASYAYFCVTLGVWITAFYTFRMYFMVFHGKARYGHVAISDAESWPSSNPHEASWKVTLPLLLLAIPSLLVGYFTIGPVLYGEWFHEFLVLGVLTTMQSTFHGATTLALHGFGSLPFGLMLLGIGCAWFMYLRRPDIPAKAAKYFHRSYTLLDNKYYVDRVYESVFASGARFLGRLLCKGGDQLLIDGVIINGVAGCIKWWSLVLRRFQNGLVYQYAFWMMAGVVTLLAMLWPYLRTGLQAS